MAAFPAIFFAAHLQHLSKSWTLSLRFLRVHHAQKPLYNARTRIYTFGLICSDSRPHVDDQYIRSSIFDPGAHSCIIRIAEL